MSRIIHYVTDRKGKYLFRFLKIFFLLLLKKKSIVDKGKQLYVFFFSVMHVFPSACVLVCLFVCSLSFTPLCFSFCLPFVDLSNGSDFYDSASKRRPMLRRFKSRYFPCNCNILTLS